MIKFRMTGQPNGREQLQPLYFQGFVGVQLYRSYDGDRWYQWSLFDGSGRTAFLKLSQPFGHADPGAFCWSEDQVQVVEEFGLSLHSPGYTEEWECGCVLPEQSCSACRQAAREAYGEGIPY